MLILCYIVLLFSVCAYIFTTIYDYVFIPYFIESKDEHVLLYFMSLKLGRHIIRGMPWCNWQHFLFSVAHKMKMCLKICSILDLCVYIYVCIYIYLFVCVCISVYVKQMRLWCSALSPPKYLEHFPISLCLDLSPYWQMSSILL